MSKTLAQWTAFFRSFSAFVSGLKRYEESRLLISGFGYYAFIFKDPFEFFSNVVTQLQNLVVHRGDSFDLDDILRMRINEITPSVSYNLEFLLADNTVVGRVDGGIYGIPSQVTLLRERGPSGTIILDAPSTAPTLDTVVQIELVPSALFQAVDEGDGTEPGQESVSAAQETHRIQASNFEAPLGVLYQDARDVILTEKFIPQVVRRFVGLDAERVDVFAENAAATEGVVTASPTGILVELDNLMIREGQTVQGPLAEPSFSTPAFYGVGQGTFTISKWNGVPPACTLVASCVKGFAETDVADNDGEEFALSFTELLKPVEGGDPDLNLRPFRTYTTKRFALTMELARKALANDPYGRMTNITLKNVNKVRIPTKQLQVEATLGTDPVTGATQGMIFRLPQAAGNQAALATLPSGGGSLVIKNGRAVVDLTNGLYLEFDWTDNPSAPDNETITFLITIYPFENGDRISVTITQDGTGLLNEELRKFYGFTFKASSANPTVREYVAKDMPFVLGKQGH